MMLVMSHYSTLKFEREVVFCSRKLYEIRFYPKKVVTGGEVVIVKTPKSGKD